MTDGSCDLPTRDFGRREFLALAGALAGAAAVVPTRAGAAPIGSGGIPGLLDDFLALPGDKSAQLDVDAVTEALARDARSRRAAVLWQRLQDLRARDLPQGGGGRAPIGIRAARHRRQHPLGRRRRVRAPERHDRSPQRARGHDRAQRQHGNRRRAESRRPRQGARLHRRSGAASDPHSRLDATLLLLPCRLPRR